MLLCLTLVADFHVLYILFGFLSLPYLGWGGAFVHCGHYIIVAIGDFEKRDRLRRKGEKREMRKRNFLLAMVGYILK